MVSIRLSQEMEMALDELCETTQRSKSFYIKEAISRYLEDISDSYVAMDRAARPNRRFLSNDQVAAMIHARTD